MGMTPHNERPEECRDTCQVAQCEGSGCRFLHDEVHPVRVPPAPDHMEDDLTMVDHVGDATEMVAPDHIRDATKMIDDQQGTLIVEVPYIKKDGRHVRRET